MKLFQVKKWEEDITCKLSDLQCLCMVNLEPHTESYDRVELWLCPVKKFLEIIRTILSLKLEYTWRTSCPLNRHSTLSGVGHGRDENPVEPCV